MTCFPFCRPGDFFDKHQGLCVALVLLCISLVDWMMK